MLSRFLVALLPCYGYATKILVHFFCTYKPVAPTQPRSSCPTSASNTVMIVYIGGGNKFSTACEGGKRRQTIVCLRVGCARTSKLYERVPTTAQALDKRHRRLCVCVGFAVGSGIRPNGCSVRPSALSGRFVMPFVGTESPFWLFFYTT